MNVSKPHAKNFKSDRGSKRSGETTMINKQILVLMLAALMMVNPVAADDVDHFLKITPPPQGVVFEIVEAGKDRLADLLPKVLSAIEKIRSIHPQMEFAVVSHGREEFALQTKNQGLFAGIHEKVKSLVADDVPVHVCETHASWYGVTPEDFPDYVNVAPTGPGQIALYEELGYHLIVIE
ncbi:MAG: intracellular sulfur oxidation DsrE/DsrF family protein [Planctomycetota bacterium]|jgi:intracellular sulfur oxidation DsrE/DsrF family protein